MATKQTTKVVVTMKPLYLDIDGAAEALSLSRTTVQDGPHNSTPTGIVWSSHCWLVREVEEWAEARPLSDMLPPPSGDGKS
jgi:prophage regulatory protein